MDNNVEWHRHRLLESVVQRLQKLNGIAVRQYFNRTAVLLYEE
jgi:hypothetical protein